MKRLMHIHKLCMVEARKTDEDHDKDGIEEYAWDGVTGEELEVDRVRLARKEAMPYSREKKVWGRSSGPKQYGEVGRY